MTQVWTHAASDGISVLIHLESHLTDDKATTLRSATYQHLRRHWQFINELKLFEIQHQKLYGVNVYGRVQQPAFLHATSLYHPDTVIRSLRHDGTGDEPGFKDPEGIWDMRPHSGRIQRVTMRELELWSEVLGDIDALSTHMLYAVNSAATEALAQLSNSPRVSTLGLNFSAGWHERADRERGRFFSEWGVAPWNDAILQGPHLYVSAPLYKAPNPTMLHHLDWSLTDFEALARMFHRAAVSA